uniref:PAS domain-containing protein n=1 Tax=Norrisiella sphaerica TaxID=552664 RepID=A0A7S2QTZ8_9EUKA
MLDAHTPLLGVTEKRGGPIAPGKLVTLSIISSLAFCIAVSLFTGSNADTVELIRQETKPQGPIPPPQHLPQPPTGWLFKRRHSSPPTVEPAGQDEPSKPASSVIFRIDGLNVTLFGFKFNILTALKGSICPTVGALLATLLAFAPLPAIRKAKQLKTLTTNPAPYPAMFANATNWVAYAFVIKDPFVFIGNLPGMVMGLYYTISAFDVSQNKDHRRLVRRLVYGYAVIFPMIAALLAIFIKNDQMTQYVLANFSMAFLITFYAAPLLEAQTVIEQKNSSSLDAKLAWYSLANAGMWLIYGLALGDFCIWFPNILGAILALIQLGLKCYYPSVPIDEFKISEALVCRPGSPVSTAVPGDMTQASIITKEYLSGVLFPVLRALDIPNVNGTITSINDALKQPDTMERIQKVLRDHDQEDSKSAASPSQTKFSWISRDGSMLVEEQVSDQSSAKGFRQLMSKELQVNSKATLSGSKISFCVTDREGVIQSCSEKFLEITGYSLYEVCGVNCNLLQRGPDGKTYAHPDTIKGIRNATDKGVEHHTVVYNFDKWGKAFWNLLHLYPVKTNGIVQRYIGVQEVISEAEAHKFGGKIGPLKAHAAA